MSSSLTSRLKLYKADPGTGEPVDVAKLNQSFDKIDTASAASPITATTHPATPFDGQFIRETDTRRLYVWNATQSTWDEIVVPATKSGITWSMTATTDPTHLAALVPDSGWRHVMFADGRQEWGSGAGARDTNLYRDSANVLKSDDTFISSGVAVTSDTTNSVGITATETTIATISNYTFLAGVAYEVKFFQPWFADADGRLANFKVHKTNSAGTDWGEFFRIRSAGASLVMMGQGERYLVRAAGAGNLTATLVLTAYAPEGGTITMRGNVANSPRWFMVRPCGVASEYAAIATTVT